MDNNNKRIEKIYSRERIRIPKIQYYKINRKNKNKENNNINNKKMKKIIKICIVLIIAFVISNILVKAIEPVVDKQCITKAKSIATKVSNEQATKVMSKYNYQDLINVVKDEEGNVKMLSSNMITVNEIISDVPILIQEELDKIENSKFYIRLGSFTGSKLLSGRGPNVEIKMSPIGDIETNLKSEFIDAGINQTLHRIYLEVRCNVTILTPFNNIEEEIINQILLTENIIVGNIPSTYYNLNGISQDNLLDVIE